jgi:hypothetical protein
MPAKKNNKKGGKGKGGKGAPAPDALQQANGIVDTVPDEYKRQLREECRALDREIEKEEKRTGLFMDERTKINYFWLIAKKELEDKQAELRNKEREC